MDGWMDGCLDGWMEEWRERDSKRKSLSGGLLDTFLSVQGCPLHACSMCLQKARVGPLGWGNN